MPKQHRTTAPEVEHLDTRLARLVRDSGFKQETVARRLGLNASTVSRRLRGETRFTAAELPALAQMLGVTITQLLEED